jgi:hypothetical protein
VRGENAWLVIDAIDDTARVADNVARVRELGSLAGRGAKMTASGASRWHREAAGARGRGRRDLVSGELFHGDGDRKRALAQLTTEWHAFAADIVNATKTPDVKPSFVTWAALYVAPTLAEWDAFERNESTWSARFATDWQTFEAWQFRLRQLRELARIQGATLASPEPVTLPRTIWQKGERGSGDSADVLWTMLKTIVYAAVAVTGVVTLYAVARDVRGTKDPSP